MENTKWLIVLAGPTGVGKTDLSIRLAQAFDAEIISSDSRQFYRELNIGTAKPTADERAAVPHHFIDTLSVQEAYTVGQYEQDVLAFLESYFQRKNVAFLVGGSGLFIKAVCEGLDQFPPVDPAVREAVRAGYERQGLTYLQELVAARDPIYYQEVDQQNPRRLMRAAELILTTGQPFSSFRKQAAAKRPFKIAYVALERERAELYERINQRVDQMMDQGLEAEARSVYPFREIPALQTVGYQELFDYFEEQCSLEEAVAKIKQNSRRYAKRQGTWLRRADHWQRFRPEQEAEIMQKISMLIAEQFDESQNG